MLIPRETVLRCYDTRSLRFVLSLSIFTVITSGLPFPDTLCPFFYTSVFIRFVQCFARWQRDVGRLAPLPLEVFRLAFAVPSDKTLDLMASRSTVLSYSHPCSRCFHGALTFVINL